MAIKSTGYFEAGKLLQELYLKNDRLPDVLFIDLPLNEEDLHRFCLTLKRNLLLNTLPLIYNEKHLTDKQVHKLNHLQLVDDILMINSNKVDYHSNVMFLKQYKIYHQAATPVKAKATQKDPVRIPLFLKRVVDIFIASACILILSPVLLLIALIVTLESKGPVFYTSLRAGNGFKVFKFYKFRSMVADADKEIDKLSEFNQYDSGSGGPMFFKVNNDPRITKFGRFLRNVSADELPQLLNVLKGDMSLVGNRPLPIYEAVTLTTDEFVERFSAPAGITGLWQVNKRGKADMSTEERINLDITYSKNFSFYYDLKIMVKTPMAIFQKSDV